MKGLKSVYGLLVERNGVAPTEAFGIALVDGLRENTKLQKIFDNEVNVRTIDSMFTPDLAREINFYLGLNRNGRMLLRLSGDSEPRSGILNLEAGFGLGCSPSFLVHATRASFFTFCRTSPK
jgi:hypothetical protein